MTNVASPPQAPEFTQEQQKIISHRGSAVVLAGAGSGKTRVIVEWYCRALLHFWDDADFDQIVVVTFTEKAGAELKSRIRKRLKELSESERGKLTDKQWQRLTKAIQFLSIAPIGTIHSYCAKLLRDLWEIAGVDPDFKILDTLEQLQLARECIEKTLAKWENGSPDQQDALVGLLTLSTRKNRLIEILQNLLSRRIEFEPIAERYLENDDLANLPARVHELCDEWNKDIPLSRLQELGKILNNLETDGELRRAAAMLEDPSSPEDERVETAKTVLETLLTKDNRLRKKYINLQNSCPHLETKLGELRDFLSPYWRRANSREEDETLLTFSCLLGHIFLDVLREYRGACSGQTNGLRQDLFDFPELEIRVRDLLKNEPTVRKEVTQKLKALIVDEYQDTSRIQWEIFRLLSGEAAAEPFLFVVGDRNQAIYTWRNASSEVFQETQAFICDRKKGATFSLTSNFRSAPVILEVVNDVCGELIGEYQKLIPGNLQNNHTILPSGVVYLEMSIPERNADPAASDSPPANSSRIDRDHFQAYAIATTVKQLVSAEVCKEGDIAILCRKRRYFPLLEMALRKCKVDFITHGGAALFDQPEIVDVVNVLRVVLDSEDDLAMLGMLRGGLFRCSDDMLFRIAFGRRGSLWKRCKDALEDKDRNGAAQRNSVLDPYEKDHLQFALNLCEHLRRRLGAAGTDVIIEDILDRTGAWGLYSFTRGEQALTNLRKLVSLARRFGTQSIGAFLEFAEAQEDQQAAEAEAPIPAAMESKIKIMTIHAAKGLEFPVVILPYLETSINTTASNPISDGEQWFLYSPPEMSSPLLELLKENQKLRAREEEKHVLYVGMTRASKLLILAATPEGKNNALGWLTPVILGDRFEEVRDLTHLLAELSNPSASNRRWRLELTSGTEFDSDASTFSASFADSEREESATEIEPTPALDSTCSLSSEGPRYNWSVLTPERAHVPRHLTVTVSEFLTFRQSPELYFIKYILENPAAGTNENSPRETDIQPQLSAAERGTLLHETFERMLRMKQDNVEMSRQWLRDRLSTLCPILSEQDVEGELDALCEHVNKALNSDTFKRLRQAQRLRFEVPYLASLTSDIALSGKLDCEAWYDEKELLVVDFKTGEKEEKTPTASGSIYDLQMKIYLWMMWKRDSSLTSYPGIILYTGLGKEQRFDLSPADLMLFDIELKHEAEKFRTFLDKYSHGDILLDERLFGELAKECNT